jgi:hypothetical protein
MLPERKPRAKPPKAKTVKADPRLANRVRCPTCEAAPGRGCIDAPRGYFHRARLRAAKRRQEGTLTSAMAAMRARNAAKAKESDVA